MTTDVTIYANNGALARPGGFGVEGLEGLDQSDIILPRYAIVQPTSKRGDDHYGHFFNNLTEETTPVLRAVILRISRSRTRWSDELGQGRPLCSSYDGVTSRDGQVCATCPYNTWGEGGCRQGYTLLCVDHLSREMFLLGAMGTSVRPAKLLTSIFASKRRPPYSALTEFTTVKAENDRGKYYVLKGTVVSWLEGDELATYRARYQGAPQQSDIHEVEPEEADAGDAEDLPF